MKKIYLLLLFFLVVNARVANAQATVYYTLEKVAGSSYSVNPGDDEYYTITPGFAYYNWVVSPEVTILGGQGTNTVHVIFNHVTCGGGTVTVQFGCNSTTCMSLTLSIAELYAPNQSGTDFNITADPNIPSNPLCMFGLTSFQVHNTGLTTPDYYDWTYTEVGSSAPPAHFSSPSLSDHQGITFDHPGVFVVACRPGFTGCGLGNPAYYTVTVVNCDVGGGGKIPMGFAAYPNPAGDVLTITSTEKNVASTQASSPKAFTYKIYNDQGKLVKSGKSSGADAKVDTHDLPSKIYILNLFVGDKVIQKQIIVQHN